MNLLYAGVHTDRAGLKAACFVSDLLVEGSDAISVHMEHRDGGPAMVLLQHYTKKRFGRGIVLGAITAIGVERSIWRTG